MEKVKLERNKPHQKYITADGTEVPGGSTICKLGDDPGALIHWAWNLGREGKDYRAERDKAADIGTIAHFMCEAFLNGFVCDLSDYSQEDIDRALICYNKFVDWWEAEGLTKVATETQLVHNGYRYGGTIDLVAQDKEGNHCLIDLKTSKRISEGYIRQIAGYTELWNVNNTKEIHQSLGASKCAAEISQGRNPYNWIKRWAIVRIGKQDEGDFEVVWYDAERIHNAFRTFKSQAGLYWAMKEEKDAVPKKPRGRKKK
jgi:hypothetical protein